MCSRIGETEQWNFNRFRKWKGVRKLDFLSDEFVFARTGEPLEDRLRKSKRFQQQMKSLHKASKAFSGDSGLSKKDRKLYDMLEDEWTKYNSVYGEESYRLGFEDGVQLAAEHMVRANGSVLSVKDMTHLIYVYDALKKLNKLLLGTWEVHNGAGGILEELNRVCDVIESGVCAEIRLQGEDGMHEQLEDILDDSEMSPEDRAKRLAEPVGA